MKDHVERTPREPRILIYDIETAPNVSYTWGKYDQHVNAFVSEKYILCFAYRWYGEDEVHIIGQTDFPREYKRDKKDDRRVVQELHKLFEEADILIAHNGDAFDHKEVQSRFLFHRMPLTSPYKTVDTKKVAKRHGRFNSNSLNDLANYLGIGHKTPHFGFIMWQKIIEDRDPEMWQLMRDYNVQDVHLLTEVYEIFLRHGWITNHPNLATISGRLECCPSCGSERLHKRGLRHKNTITYQQYQCQDCTGYFSERRAGTGPRFS